MTVCLLAGICHAQQIRISGKVLEASTKQAAIAANVVLQTNDSTFVNGAATDNKGIFRIEKVAEGSYKLVISAIGFKKSVIDLQGLSQSVDLGTLELEEASQQLEEVTVSATNVVSKFDRKLVFPNKQQITASNSGVDLLRNLMLPRLNVNPLDGSVSLNDGSSVQLCINGRKVGKEEIQALIPSDILRIEYLEDPGLRYGDAGAVVNYIVRRYELGGSVSTSAQQSPYVMWGNYNVSGKVNYKKSEFGIWYGAYSHKFENAWRTNEETFAKEDGTFLHRTEEGIPDVTSEYAQWGGISYNLQEADNYMLNASIGFWNENKPRTGFHSTLYTREYPELATERLDFAHNRNSRPWFDIYFQKELKKKQFLALNVVGTYIGSHNRQNYQEILDNEFVADYFSGVQGDKYSIIAEGIYEKTFKKSRFSSGIKHTQAYSDNEYSGTLNYNTQMKQADTYAYAQYSGKWKKMNYTLGAGVSIPLNDLFDLKGRVSRQRLTLKSAQLEQEIKYDEIKKNIIEMYAMATSQIRVLQMKSESLILANVQYEISEKNFANGTIESTDLATDKERQSQAREAYEKSKFELTKSLMILEIISRTPIIRK